LSSAAEVKNTTGRYYVKKKAVRSSEASYDRAASERLWQVSAELTGL
jgi:hypothetical protein